MKLRRIQTPEGEVYFLNEMGERVATEKDILIKKPEGSSNHVTKNIPSYLFDGNTALFLQVVGWVYFIISLIGGLYLWANSKSTTNVGSGIYSQSIEVINYANLAVGIVGVFTSVIVLAICLGLAKVIEQNIYLLIEKK